MTEMSRFVVVLGLLAIISLLLTFVTAFYNLYLHPLRHYPGPFLWASFRFPYVAATHRGELHRRLKDFHTQYGSIVRIAPNELSYADARAWKDIYASGSSHRCERNRTWFMKTAPSKPHSILTHDESTHARFRRAFAHSFSDRSLRDQAPVMENYVSILMEQLKSLVTSEGRVDTNIIDLNQWFNYFTFDLASDLCFSESFDCMRNKKAHLWVEITQDFGKGLALLASINSYAPLNKLLEHLIPKQIVQRGKTHREISAAKARRRLAFTENRPDFVTPTKQYSDRKGSISPDEWEINLAALVFAASETTASALIAIVREVLQQDEILSTLTQKIRASFKDESEITMESTGNLQYLNAVIDEGLRLDPPVVIGIPRVVPPKGGVICGKWVPGGTYVAYNQFPANRQAYNFQQPNSFLPERFLHPDLKADNMPSFRPFSTGRHSCIGMRFAYAEIRLVLARLFWTFDVQLAHKADRWDWGEQRTYILWVRDQSSPPPYAPGTDDNAGKEDTGS